MLLDSFFILHVLIKSVYLRDYFSRDYNLFSHSTNVVCVNFINDWHSCQIDQASNRQILEKNRQNRQERSWKSSKKKIVTKYE